MNMTMNKTLSARVSTVLRSITAVVVLGVMTSVPFVLAEVRDRWLPAEPFHGAVDDVVVGRVPMGALVFGLWAVVGITWCRLAVAVVAEVWRRLRRRPLGDQENRSGAASFAFLLVGSVLAAISMGRVTFASTTGDPVVCIPDRPAAGPESGTGSSATGEGASSNRHDREHVVVGGAVLAAAGAIGLLEIRRVRRLRRARALDRFAAPAPGVSGFERALRVCGAAERFARLDLALRVLAGHIVNCEPSNDAAVRIALLGDDGAVEIMISASVPPVEPFTTGDDDFTWRLPANVDVLDLVPLVRVSTPPCPALAHVGRTVGADVFVDLEACGVLGVDVSGDRADPIIQAILGGLALSPFVAQMDLIATGLPDAGRLAGVQCVGGLDEALELAAIRSGSVAAAARSVGSTGSLALRAATGRRLGLGEAWEPVVIAAGIGPLPEVEPGSGLAVVGPGRSEAGCTLVEHDGVWTLEPVGLVLRPLGSVWDEIRAIRAVLDHAEFGPLETPLPSPVPPAPAPIDAPPTAAPGNCATGPTLFVRVLGVPDVVDTAGVAVSFERSKALELVVWLAFHRSRSTRSAARTALWETDVRDATFANVVSDARRSMARALDPPVGQEWIARTLTDELPLHRAVATDVDLVEACLQRARHLDDAAAIVELDEAIRLVRGVPLEGTSYAWADAEGVSTNLVMLCIDVSATLAGCHLRRGDVRGVLEATAVGLRVLPGHEELLALRLRAHAAAGDLAGVRAEWATYERALAADPWSDDPAESLVVLRGELVAGLTRTGRECSSR
jgi:hypothetical protein